MAALYCAVKMSLLAASTRVREEPRGMLQLSFVVQGARFRALLATGLFLGVGCSGAADSGSAMSGGGTSAAGSGCAEACEVGKVCASGACVCATGTTQCDSGCFDLQTNNANCG